CRFGPDRAWINLPQSARPGARRLEAAVLLQDRDTLDDTRIAYIGGRPRYKTRHVVGAATAKRAAQPRLNQPADPRQHRIGSHGPYPRFGPTKHPAAASVPLPTLVSLCRARFYKRRKQGDTSNSLSLVWLRI